MFWHRLALELGRTVAELQMSMSSPEFTQWMAYYSIAPFGEERADLRAGIIASTTANANRKKGRRDFVPKDYMIDFSGEKKVMTNDELYRRFKALTIAKKGKIIKVKNGNSSST